MSGQRRRRGDELMPISVDAPRWLVVRNMTGKNLRVDELKPNTDLRGTLIHEHHEYSSRGWTGEQPGHGRNSFFMQKDSLRVCIAIVTVEPGSSSSRRWPTR